MIQLEIEIIHGLSSKGVLAYIAVKMAEGTVATTAALAGLVRVQTAVMREGLNELLVGAPGLLGVHKQKGKQDKWRCGEVKIGEGVQILDSERYRLFVDDLKRYWDVLNRGSGLPFSMGGRDGLAIRAFLNDCKDWTQSDWRVALNNRTVSVVRHGSASRTEAMFAWVRSLPSYAAGPLDRFGKPVGGSDKHEKVISIQHGNREAGASFLDRILSREGAKSSADRGVSDKVRHDRGEGTNGGSS